MDARSLSLRAKSCTAPLLALVATLTGCGEGADQLPQGNASRPVAADGSPLSAEALSNMAGVTPMAQRVAVIGLLNKRNGLTRDLTMKPGQALRVNDAIVRLRACEATAPWEGEKEVGAFVQLDVRTPRKEEWRRVFSGWVFRERPERNVVQHPVYDVWVRSCAMKWPDTGPDTVKVGDRSGANADAASGPGPADNSADSSASEMPDSATSNSAR